MEKFKYLKKSTLTSFVHISEDITQMLRQMINNKDVEANNK